ncbi:MAG: 50S ribosomal protein L10 [Acidobacteria bacterium]|nr:MAG: 50S ribosomal protein L10 [Acidobacteriota bacterium]
MPRTKQQKQQEIDAIREVFDGANSLYLVSLTGLTSNEINELRASLRQKGARIRVVKNRLAKRAAEGSAVKELERWFVGPTAVVYHPEEPISAAKGLVDFAKTHPALEIKGGLVDRRETLDADGVRAVSQLPGLEETRAMLLSLINGPATRLLRLLSTPATQLARVIGERSRQEQ